MTPDMMKSNKDFSFVLKIKSLFKKTNFFFSKLYSAEFIIQNIFFLNKINPFSTIYKWAGYIQCIIYIVYYTY